jgi:hypothetical protein
VQHQRQDRTLRADSLWQAVEHRRDFDLALQSPIAVPSAVRKTYQLDSVSVPVLMGIHILVRPGRFAVSLGPSDAGNTTLAQPDRRHRPAGLRRGRDRRNDVRWPLG